MPRSMFVSFEGGDGSGKSTQANLLHRRLVESGYPAVMVHEPGSTELGWYLSDYLKSERRLSREAELLLFAAARAELVGAVVAPSLRRGQSVVADRYADSTVAYQGYGRRLDMDFIRTVNSFAMAGTVPDVTFLLDQEPEKGLRRVGQPQMQMSLEPDAVPHLGRQDPEGRRRFEDTPISFHRRVRDGYLRLASEEPQRWVILDATAPTEEIAERVWGKVASLLGPPDVTAEAGAL